MIGTNVKFVTAGYIAVLRLTNVQCYLINNLLSLTRDTIRVAVVVVKQLGK